MDGISLQSVRTVLTDMDNLYVGTYTDEELNEASLSDDLGIQDNEFPEFIERLEDKANLYFEKAALLFMQDEKSLTIHFLRRLSKYYTHESKEN